MIERLTQAQESELPKFREEWRQIGLSTVPIDRPKAVEAVSGLYEAAGLTKPDYVFFFTSPALCLLARKLFQQLGNGDQLWDQLRGQLEGQLWDQLRGQLWDQLRGQLWDQLEDQLRGQDVFQAPWTIGGQDAYWLSFYEFARFVGVRYSNNDHLNAYVKYAKSCGWMFAYDKVAFVSERPVEINWDDRGLLHSETGMSVKFRDGWGVHSWHGIKIPEEWIENKSSITPQVALHHENVEQRRAACEILGWHNILRELNAETIDKSSNPFVGELLQVVIPNIGKEKFLRVKCGTEREFALPVPPEMQRASEAQAWLNFTTEDMYLPNVRT